MVGDFWRSSWNVEDGRRRSRRHSHAPPPRARLRRITGVKKGQFQFQAVCPSNGACLYDMPFVMRIAMH